jgi:hypothetical protein
LDLVTRQFLLALRSLLRTTHGRTLHAREAINDL